MGKLQRTKGEVYEREVAHELNKQFGLGFKRVLGQARDSGGDVTSLHMDILFECKRRKTLKGMYDWMRQAEISAICHPGPRKVYPALVFRADGEESIVAFRLADLQAVVSEMMRDA